MKLFSFWRSLATYRVRIAMNLKGLKPDEVVEINLMKGQQREEAFRKVNPMMAIPALVDGDGPALFESLAIIEYLDETHPNPPLLPKDPKGRARARGIAQIVACDSHPLIVPRVRHYLLDEWQVGQEKMLGWIRHWLGAGLEAMETLLAEHKESGRFCHGERPTIADIALVTQVTPAKGFDCDLAPYPRVMRVYDSCMAIPAFADAAPAKQPDAE